MWSVLFFSAPKNPTNLTLINYINIYGRKCSQAPSLDWLCVVMGNEGKACTDGQHCESWFHFTSTQLDDSAAEVIAVLHVGCPGLFLQTVLKTIDNLDSLSCAL